MVRAAATPLYYARNWNPTPRFFCAGASRQPLELHLCNRATNRRALRSRLLYICTSVYVFIYVLIGRVLRAEVTWRVYTYIYIYIYICIYIYIKRLPVTWPWTYTNLHETWCIYIQPIAHKVAQNLECVSQNIQFCTRRTWIFMGFIISTMLWRGTQRKSHVQNSSTLSKLQK